MDMEGHSHIYARMALRMYGDVMHWRPGVRLLWVCYQEEWERGVRFSRSKW